MDNEDHIRELSSRTADILENILVRASDEYRSQIKPGLETLQTHLNFKLKVNERSVRGGGIEPKELDRDYRIATDLLSGFHSFKDPDVGSICTDLYQVSKSAYQVPMPTGNLQSDFYVLALNAVKQLIVREDKGTFTDELESISTNFILHHINRPVRHVARMFCLRLWTDKEYELLPGVRIRPATPHDALRCVTLLARSMPATDLYYEVEWLSSIIEIERDCLSIWQLQWSCFRFAFLLSLYRTFQLNCRYLAVHSADISDMGHDSYLKLQNWPEYKSKWVLQAEEISQLRTFLNAVSQREIPDGLFIREAPQFTPLYITCKHYQDSFRPGYIFERAASSVMGLESLVLPNEAELKHRMRLHVAQLLSLVDDVELEPLKTYENLGHAYDMRSVFVHGSGPDKSSYPEQFYQQITEASDPVLVIADYLRLLIIFFLKKRISRDRLTVLLDKSLLSDESKQQLRDEFSSGIELARHTLCRSRKEHLRGMFLTIKSLGPDGSEYVSARDGKIKP